MDYNEIQEAYNQIIGNEDYPIELRLLVLSQQLDGLTDDMNVLATKESVLKRRRALGLLSEEDFYPPSDNRTIQSNVLNIDDSNNFSQFAHNYFELCDEEEIFN